jgi:hypothetical protein
MLSGTLDLKVYLHNKYTKGGSCSLARLHYPVGNVMKKIFSLLQIYLVIILLVTITGCSSGEPQDNKQLEFLPNIFSNPVKGEPDLNPAAPTNTLPAVDPPTNASQVSVSATPGFTSTPNSTTTAMPANKSNTEGGHSQTLPPENWQDWPVIPVVSDHARDIYRTGLAQGHDPSRFSKVGDCQNIRQYFLGMFDDPATFRLGNEATYLQGTIDQFSGSWHRLSEAVRTGFNVASVLTPLYASPDNCGQSESPLACEIRSWNPSFVIISMETWTSGSPTDTYEGYLRQIVEYALSQNILPIVATKADNLEGDNSINLAVARVAAAYDIPLWNFWRAVQSLPDHGLTADNFHLTNAYNQFDNPDSLQKGWPVRNLTALQTIDAVWKAVK